ncbi:hypothetical protein EAF04_004957 [Stromatinia cepivora]|nr:hypothetical protein EAF04_004957 [Stromatinia cepivora]
MAEPLKTAFETCCSSLKPSRTPNNRQINLPPELIHFFSPIIMIPVTALNNHPHVSSLLDAPYVIQIFPIYVKEGLKRSCRFFLPRNENVDPDDPSQFLRFFHSASSMDKGLKEEVMLKDAGYMSWGRRSFGSMGMTWMSAPRVGCTMKPAFGGADLEFKGEIVDK